MSSGNTGGRVGVEIPASTKKVVQNLKEVVGNSDEEIYAMLKECNMDPNETVQRLLNQDPFHEVKRKRDKKKETGGNKESADVRGRPGSGGNYGRGGGRGGAGRGNSLTRHSSHEYFGGRGRPFGRENGIHPSSRGSSAVSNPNSSGPAFGQPKPVSSAPISAPSPAASQPATPLPQPPMPSAGSSPSLPNGSSGFVRPAPAPHGAWGSGQITMADILKAQAASLPSFQPPAASPPTPPVQSAYSPSYSVAAPPVPSSESSEFYSSTTDPVLHSSLDSRALGSQGAIKRDVGTVGNQRPIGDRPVGSSSIEINSISTILSQPSPATQAVAVSPPVDSGSLETEPDVPTVRPSSPLAVVSSSSDEDLSVDQAALAMEMGTSVRSQPLQHPGRAVLGGSQFSGRTIYAAQQQPVGTQKAASGTSLEWKPKSSVPIPGGTAVEVPAQGMSAVDTTRMTETLQSLHIQDDEPVILPSHLRMPEAMGTQLSFGSFDADFRSSFGTSFGLEEVEKSSVIHVESVQSEEAPVEQPISSSVAAPVELAPSYGHQQVSTPVENIIASNEVPSIVLPSPVAQPLEQVAKPDPVVHQSPHYPFLGVSSYPGFGLIPQIPGGQYNYEQAESQPQDVSRIPSLMQPYSDPTTSYYTSAFRPGADGDARYPTYATSNTSSKYSGNMGLMTGPTLPTSQEGVNPMLASGGPTAAPTSQPGNNAQTAQAAPQQALPMHYSAQPPLGHYGNFVGYQYMTPNYPYLQTPYHHNFNPSNNAYAQPPNGSSYPPAAASSFPTGGATPLKYPLPQYKPGAAAGNAPHSSAGVGYGGYTTGPTGYAANPVVTTGNPAGYEDINTSHYKDNTLYIPGQQQGEGSTVWIQTPLPREMGPSGGMQSSSYYNLTGQGQHTGYSHSQQPTHGHAHPGAAYANLYHPSQSGPTPGHQMLQQPQGMGVGGAGNVQAGTYQQQPQRAQQTWNPNY